MNTTQRTIYTLFSQTVILLIFYAIASLLASFNFLPPPILNGAIDFVHANAFSHVMLQLALQTGLIASGLYILSAENPQKTLSPERNIIWLGRGWTVLLVLAVVAGALGQLDGRYALELPLILAIFEGVLWIAFLAVVWMNTPKEMPVMMVWFIGGIVVAVCHFVGLISLANPIQDRILRVFVINMQLNVGLVVMAVAVVFWLMRRFSNVRQPWADASVYNVAGLLAIAGSFVSASPLVMLGLSDTMGILALIVAPIALTIYAAHSYQAFSDNNANYTLSAHWTALSVVIWFLSLGILGTVLAIPDVAKMAQGTRLTDVQMTLTSLGIVSILLGMMNQAVAELRGENRRITGLLPFWLWVVGVLGSGLALIMAGVVQTYLERLLSMGYLDTQIAIAPLYVGWLVGLFAIMLGIIIYALGFRARRV